MADEFTEELVAYMKRMFFLFDRNYDGEISSHDLGVVMRALGLNPTEAEIQAFINEIPAVDGHVKIDFPEFLTFMGRQMKNIREVEELRESFRIFDKEGTGYISTEELYHIITHLGELLTKTEVEQFMLDAEVDGEGKVNYEDFVTLITSK